VNTAGAPRTIDLEAFVSSSSGLVPLPQAYVRVRELVNDPNAGAAQIAAVISHDPSLTAHMLRVANSPYFGCGGTIDTVARAVRVLGTDAVHQLALALSAIHALKALRSDLLDPALFWRRSVHCAVLARLIARHRARARDDGLFVAGLLHGVGHLLLCHQLPNSMRTWMAAARAEGEPLQAVERRELGFDYAEVGAGLLAQWQLPGRLVAAVRAHTAPAAQPEFNLDAALIHVAAVLAAGAAWRPGDPDTVPSLNPLALQVADLEPDAIEPLLQSSETELADALEAVLPRSAVARGGAPARRPHAAAH
jgi:HD-like signal output (HDOD) protein